MSYHWGGPLAAAGVFGASQLLQQKEEKEEGVSDAVSGEE